MKEKESSGAWGSVLQISQLASSVAQVLMVFVVVFGYFYTVVPVYERDRLSEEKQRLETENQDLRSETARLRDGLDEYLKTRDRIRSASIKSEVAISELESRKWQLEGELTARRESLARISADLSRLEGQALAESVARASVERSLLRERLGWAVAMRVYPSAVSPDDSQIWYGLREGDLDELLASSWVDYAVKLREWLAASNIDADLLSGVSQEVVQAELARLSEGARSGLGFSPCVAPNVSEWVASFNNKDTRSELAEQCFEAAELEIAEQAGWSPAELARVQSARRNRESRERLQQSCDSHANLQMQREFFRS